MKKTILIGALTLISTLAQADMDRCNSAVRLMGISLDKGIEAYLNKDFKGACSYMQLANSFVEDAMIKCPAELQASLQGTYIQGKQTEVTVCNIK
jgi:hypothetical protein